MFIHTQCRQFAVCCCGQCTVVLHSAHASYVQRRFWQSSIGESSAEDTWKEQEHEERVKVATERWEEENRGTEMMERSDFVFDCLTGWNCPALRKDKRQNFRLFTFGDSWWQRYRRGRQQRDSEISILISGVCACMPVLVFGCVRVFVHVRNISV